MGMEVGQDAERVKEMEDDYYSDSEVVAHVREILKSATQGDVEHYEELVNELNGVINCPDRLDDDQEALLVASSSAKFIDACLDMLVCHFLPPPKVVNFVTHPKGLARKKEVLDRIHSAISDIADLVPLSPLRLLPIILHRMPRMTARTPYAALLHLDDTCFLISIYVESMLRLEGGAIGELVGSTMIMAVVDRLIDLDVEIGWDDILQEDCSKGIFDMELEDVREDSDDDKTIGSELPKIALNGQSLGGNIVADKLDNLMALTCEHLKSCAENGRLVKSFQMTVLNAYKSKFAQFVVFYACSLDPEICGARFAVLLADIFVSSTQPLLNRMSAVAYLASYLSRGRFLSSSFVGSMLKRLVDWCVEYCQNHFGEEKRMNPAAHQIFYSACQAVMYVLCFRMRSLMDVPLLKSQLFNMPLESILRHPLDPLKVCLPSIVEEFLQQAKSAGLFTISENFLFNNVLESNLSKAFEPHGLLENSHRQLIIDSEGMDDRESLPLAYTSSAD
ncbi:hypothetical protein ACLOJK_015660 [Asimina triloba]